MKIAGTILRHPKTNPQQTPSEYLTRDIYLATVLKISGIPIVRVENQSGRGIFVFRTSQRVDEIIAAYFNDDLAMNPKAIFEAWKSLKSLAFASVGNVR